MRGPRGDRDDDRRPPQRDEVDSRDSRWGREPAPGPDKHSPRDERWRDMSPPQAGRDERDWHRGEAAWRRGPPVGGGYRGDDRPPAGGLGWRAGGRDDWRWDDRRDDRGPPQRDPGFDRRDRDTFDRRDMDRRDGQPPRDRDYDRRDRDIDRGLRDRDYDRPPPRDRDRDFDRGPLLSDRDFDQQDRDFDRGGPRDRDMDRDRSGTWQRDRDRDFERSGPLQDRPLRDFNRSRESYDRLPRDSYDRPPRKPYDDRGPRDDLRRDDRSGFRDRERQRERDWRGEERGPPSREDWRGRGLYVTLLFFLWGRPSPSCINRVRLFVRSSVPCRHLQGKRKGLRIPNLVGRVPGTRAPRGPISRSRGQRSRSQDTVVVST